MEDFTQLKWNGYPKAYRRNAMTRLLYLYKMGYITRFSWINCMGILKHGKLLK